jgi:hypothetical protein
MRILVAPQEFKGSLTARRAAETVAAGLRRTLPDAELDLLPLADGGPGTVEALVEATNGEFFQTQVNDPLGRPVRARWGALGDGRSAVIEMAAASGLTLVAPEERDPRRASTLGTGELVRAALAAAYRRVIVGVGGSATNDSGAEGSMPPGDAAPRACNASLVAGRWERERFVGTELYDKRPWYVGRHVAGHQIRMPVHRACGNRRRAGLGLSGQRDPGLQ